MGIRRVLAISGSPSRSSKSVLLADAVLRRLHSYGIETDHVMTRELDPTALLSVDLQSPSLKTFLEKVAGAHGIIVATPIYKASFSGLLKAALDVLPQFALAGKVVLPLGTGGSLAHVLALDYSLRPVIQSMGTRHIVQSHFVVDVDFIKSGPNLDSDDAHMVGLRNACENFLHSLTDDAGAAVLGHPRPVPSIGLALAVNADQQLCTAST